MKPLQQLQSLPADTARVIVSLRERLTQLLRDQMVGLYLSGSIAYGCFNPDTSDVDFTCVIKRPTTAAQQQRLKQIFEDLRSQERYGRVLEGAFPLQAKMNECESPLVTDYVKDGKFNPGSRYEEWPLDRHDLYQTGLRVAGPAPERLFAPAHWSAIQRVMVARLLEAESVVKAGATPIQRLQVVLNLCRVLYGLRYRRLASKLIGLEWALRTFPETWQDLLGQAHSIYTGLASLTASSFNPDHVWAFYGWAINTLPQDTYAQAQT